MVLAKICGIKTPEDAHAVADAGADALGFHVELTGGRSPLSASEAAALISKLPDTVASVVVTSVDDADKLIQLARTTGATTLQLYGDATPETITAVKEGLPAIEIWKVINVADDSAIEAAKKYDGVADSIVLDKAQSASVRGGSGQTLDWDIAKRIVETVSTPVILAGGLTPLNVAEAVRTVGPFGVDVNSGVSNADGTKDIEKVRSFLGRSNST